MAILLGITATGGVVRDVLLNRVPVILRKEVYASAALVGATIEVVGEGLGWSSAWLPRAAMLTCVGSRFLALRYGWHLRLEVAARD